MSAYSLPENSHLLNRAAWKWLKQAREPVEPHYLHVLTLAHYGLENGVKGDWPKKETETLRMQLALLFGWNPQAVMLWLTDNEDGSDSEEQEADLLARLKVADDPMYAALAVLDQIWAVQKSKVPILSTVSSD